MQQYVQPTFQGQGQRPQGLRSQGRSRSKLLRGFLPQQLAEGVTSGHFHLKSRAFLVYEVAVELWYNIHYHLDCDLFAMV